MNSPVAKRLSLLGLVILFTAALVLAHVGSAMAACAPNDNSCVHAYLKSSGGDVGTGGWFNNGPDGCLSSSSLFQDSNYSPSGGSSNPLYGGILAFANASGNNSGGGSSSEFAAYALGLVEGPSAQVPNSGFYSAGLLARNALPALSSPLSYTTFANASNPVANAPWGGLFVPQGEARQASFCIPDYYGTKKPTSGCASLPGAGKLNGSLSQEIYCEDSTGVVDHLNDGGPRTITAGQKLTVFVKGSVYIKNNITYGPGVNVNQIPKFALVVQGSIYIDPSVTQLNGLYIAQPDPAAGAAQVGSDTGVIWTCHPQDATLPTDSYSSFFPSCNQKLTVHGAFIAKRIAVMRIFGSDVTAVNPGEDGYPQVLSSAAAEVINFSPDMVIGGPFFTTTGSSGGGNPRIDSLISLPPVF